MTIYILLVLLVLIYFLYLYKTVNKNKEERLKNNLDGQKSSNKMNVLYICVSAVMMALAAVLKVFGIMLTTEMRISFFALPLILTGLFCGMEWGIITSIGADLTYSLFSGYAFNPAFTLSAVYWGVLGGIFQKINNKNKLNIFVVFFGVLITSLLETHTNILVTLLLYGTATSIASLLTKYLVLVIKLPIITFLVYILNKRVINKLFRKVEVQV